MIKIDWRRLTYDYVWFGCYIMGHGHAPNKPHLLNEPYWECVHSLHCIFWPMRRFGSPLPTWWLILWEVPLNPDSGSHWGP